MRMSVGRAHDYGMHQLRQMDIVGEAAPAGEETKILVAPHRLTDTVRYGARRVHALYSADNCQLQRKPIMDIRLLRRPLLEHSA
jgi:hypothetical protein